MSDKVITKFADINITEINVSTAASIFESVDKLFSTNNITWDHCVGLGLHNTNINIGNHNYENKSKGKLPIFLFQSDIVLILKW